MNWSKTTQINNIKRGPMCEDTPESLYMRTMEDYLDYKQETNQQH